MIAYITPTLVKIASESIAREEDNIIAKVLYPFSVIAWLVISGVLSWFIGDIWVLRYLYIVIGTVNIIGSLILYA
jgi:hypothetical protein